MSSLWQLGGTRARPKLLADPRYCLFFSALLFCLDCNLTLGLHSCHCAARPVLNTSSAMRLEPPDLPGQRNLSWEFRVVEHTKLPTTWGFTVPPKKRCAAPFRSGSDKHRSLPLYAKWIAQVTVSSTEPLTHRWAAVIPSRRGKCCTYTLDMHYLFWFACITHHMP